MGSAFAAEPRYVNDPRDVVTFLTFPADDQTDLVCHLKHPECPIEPPHRMRGCGRFSTRAVGSAAQGER